MIQRLMKSSDDDLFKSSNGFKRILRTEMNLVEEKENCASEIEVGHRREKSLEHANTFNMPRKTPKMTYCYNCTGTNSYKRCPGTVDRCSIQLQLLKLSWERRRAREKER